MKRVFSALLVSATILSTGCSVLKDKNKGEEILVEISAKPGTCHTWYREEPIECMQMREVGKENEYASVPLSTISGFEYVPGYDWKLKVKKEIIKNPPADASNISYTLVKVISKKAVSL
ncbi:MAG: DUF4377 domain-containing protein [Bacteroidales bacterium]